MAMRTLDSSDHGAPRQNPLAAAAFDSPPLEAQAGTQFFATMAAWRQKLVDSFVGQDLPRPAARPMHPRPLTLSALACFALACFALVWLPSRLPAQAEPAPAALDPFAMLAQKPAAPAYERGVRVMVLQADGSPATAAIVVFTPATEDTPMAAAPASGHATGTLDEPRWCAARSADGTRYAVDERGSTRVPKGGHLLAFAGDRIAWHFVAAEAAEAQLTLALAAPHRFVVEVVGADGTPGVGVPIALQQPTNRDLTALGATGADGCLRVGLVAGRPTGTKLVPLVVARGVLAAPLPVDGAQVHVQLPATTRVSATLAGDVAPGSTLRWTLQANSAVAVPGTTTGERSASWPYVEIGITAMAIVRAESGELAKANAPIAATAATIPLTRTFALPTFATQILDADGKPASDRAIVYEWRMPRRGATHRTRSNRDGWIEVEVPQWLSDQAGELRVELGGAEATAPRLDTASVQIAATGPARTVLPPLRCAPRPLQFAGTFVTADGKPVANLAVHTRETHRQRVRTDAAGRFVLPGAPKARRLDIAIDPSWSLVDGQPWEATLTADAPDTRFVVQPSARVRFAADLGGSVLGPISYHLVAASGDRPSVHLPLEFDAATLFVPPGHWHFVARREGGELLRLPDLRCESGIELHDARFLAFDWRAYAIRVDVEVHDPAGHPCDDCVVWIRRRSGRSATLPLHGLVRLLLPKDGVDLDVTPNDPTLAPIALAQVTTNQTVVVGGGPKLTVMLQPLVMLPATVSLELHLDDRIAMRFDPNGVATVVLPKAGSYQPTLRVRGARSTFVCTGLNLAALDVPAAGRKFVLELTAEQQRTLANGIEHVMAR